MSVWKRIAETLGSYKARTGLAGSLANLLDRENWLPGGRDAAFTIAIVALSAKMAIADGVVTAAETRAFNQIVAVEAGSEGEVGQLFDLARKDVAGYDAYAKQIGRLFSDRPDTLQHVLDGLFYIAAADGIIHSEELNFLKSVSDIFGFDEIRFEQIASQHITVRQAKNPYMVLGLDPSATDDELKRVYRMLVAENHPDRLVAKNVPAELAVVVTRKMAAINDAYSAIRKTRGI
ncbi:MAG: molecular chaperone DjiA [Alphaproteobacteria bacterium]|nr:molecular chaperone DjiA [Alphaproteobacteria bacterium]